MLSSAYRPFSSDCTIGFMVMHAFSYPTTGRIFIVEGDFFGVSTGLSSSAWRRMGSYIYGARFRTLHTVSKALGFGLLVVDVSSINRRGHVPLKLDLWVWWENRERHNVYDGSVVWYGHGNCCGLPVRCFSL